MEQNVSSCSSASFCQWIREEFKAFGTNALGQPEFSNKVFWWSYFHDRDKGKGKREGIVWPTAIGNIIIR